MNSLNSTHAIVQRILWLKNVTKIIKWLQRTVDLSTNWIAKWLHIVSGDIITILFTQNVREPKWLPTIYLTGAIFSLRELWLPCSRVFVFTALI